MPIGPRQRALKAIAELDAPGAASAEFAGQSQLSPAAERRQLTVLFCDLVGSTALSGRLDPEDMRDMITAYQNASAGAVTRFEGFVAKFMGDGVLAFFGFPKAREDEAERARLRGEGRSASGIELNRLETGRRKRTSRPISSH